MSTAMISSGTHQTTMSTISKSNLSAQRSYIDPSSHLSFNTQFPKSAISIKTRTTPIKAAAATATYMPRESFYDLLGISKTGTLSDIKKAYKQLARKYHPDVSPPGRTEEYTKKFIQVQEAYETLSDPKTRAMYDRDMDRGVLDLDTIFSGRRSRRGLDDEMEWNQRWESQLAELLRMSNAKEFENVTWGDRMRRQRSYCHH